MKKWELVESIWTNSPETRIFSRRLWSNGHYHCYQTSYKFSEKHNNWFSSKSQKCKFRTLNTHIWANSSETRIFGRRRIWSNGHYHCYQTSEKNSEKHNDQFSSKSQKLSISGSKCPYLGQFPRNKNFR